MTNLKSLKILIACLTVLAISASLAGIISDQGEGQYNYTSIRGESILIYGKGIYRDMSSEVAIQGIAQDYVTLFLAVPLLIISLVISIKGSLKWRFVLAGTLAYFLLTYTFYFCMAMYNPFFLIYVSLMGISFFSLILTILTFNRSALSVLFNERAPLKLSGIFLMLSAISIAMLWLSIVLPPLLDGSIYPKAVEHYTTLIVQGFDLGIALPISFVVGFFLFKKQPFGHLLGPIYLVFLSLLMTALVAKLVYLGILGYAIFPAIVIIPLFQIVSVILTLRLLNSIDSLKER